MRPGSVRATIALLARRACSWLRRCRIMAMIVVGVDGSEGSRAALRFALEEARLRGAGLHVVHAERHYAGEQDRVAWLEDVVREVVGESPGVEIRRSIADGGAASVLVEAATEAEMLVVGSRGHGGFAGLLLGSVGQQVAHHAACPVAIVR
jgi:nucleotide-binding universal stress UspA family protein